MKKSNPKSPTVKKKSQTSVASSKVASNKYKQTESSDLNWREAELDDVKDLCHLINLSYRGDAAKRGWTTEADLLDGQRTDEKELTDLISQKNSFIFVLESKNQFSQIAEVFAGCVFLKREDNKCYMGMLTVHPDLQNLGLGKWFLAEAEYRARKWGCAHIYMNVISERTSLIEWYQRHGYTVTDQTKPFPYGDERFGIPKKDNLEFVMLKKKLIF